jgi:hypothetical protein
MVSAIVEVLLYLLVFPIAWVLMTPIILVGAFFREQPYFSAVRDGYGDVTEWCERLLDWTIWL